MQREILRFADVIRKVVKFDGIRHGGFANALPIAKAHGLGEALLVELPVEVGPAGNHLSGQRRDDGNSVDGRGRRDACNFRNCRQEIPEGPRLVAHLSRFDHAGPPCHGGDADSTFIKIALDAAERAAAVEEIGMIAPFFMRPVVAGENNERVLVQTQGR